MSHSKRNTSRPVFTSHERALAKSHWASSSARLNRDSFLSFGSCSLCLEIARDPVSCPKGDVFCRECALANIIAQKKELKRADKSRQHAELDAARRGEERHEEEKERAVRDFEMTQAGMNIVAKFKKTPATDQYTNPARDESSSKDVPLSQDLVIVNGATKRKFEDELEHTAREDHVKARKAIDDEKAAKPSLTSFWTPSLTPDVLDSKHGAPVKKAKTAPTCPASATDSPHIFSMHKLITINFDEQLDATTNLKRRTCPSCRKALSNASGGIMTKRCGHVLCQKCVNQFLLPSGKQQASKEDAIISCYSCDEPVAVKSSHGEDSKGSLPSGLVALKSEGTGFSARGTSTVEKSSVAFQC